MTGPPSSDEKNAATITTDGEWKYALELMAKHGKGQAWFSASLDEWNAKGFKKEKIVSPSQIPSL